MGNNFRRLKIGTFQFAGSGSVAQNAAAIKRGIKLAAKENIRELFHQQVDLATVSFADVGTLEQSKKIEIIQSHLISRVAKNAMFVLSANSTSQQQLAPTCRINPDGQVVGMAPLNQEALLTGEIEITPPNFGRQGRIIQSKMLTEQ
jgi:omega-amidase